MGIITLAAMVGLSYYFVNNMNQKKSDSNNPTQNTSSIDKQANTYLPTVKKFAKIYSVPWQGIMALMYASTGYGTSYYFKSGLPWGQNRLGVMGMRGDDFDYINDILKSNRNSDDRTNPEVSIEYACAFAKIIDQQIKGENAIPIRFYLGLKAESNSGKGDILSVSDFVSIYTKEWERLWATYPKD